jgi:hypothetical protein
LRAGNFLGFGQDMQGPNRLLVAGARPTAAKQSCVGPHVLCLQEELRKCRMSLVSAPWVESYF